MNNNDINSVRSLYGLSDISKDILAKPIGIVRKNHKFIEIMLNRNIGKNSYNFESIGTSISDNSNPYLNSNTIPWFKLDRYKSEYNNYLDYIDSNYFNGTMSPIRFSNKANDLMLNDKDSVYNSSNYIGVIRGFDFIEDSLSYNFISDGSTNLNGNNDTRLGIINSFYLKNILNYSNLRKRNGTITKESYKNFGLDGKFGIKNFYSMPINTVLSNESIHNNSIGDVPMDYPSLDLFFLENDSIFNNSNDLTKNFILKSILGISLIDDSTLIDIDSLNNSTIKWPKKYYPSNSKTTYLHKAFGDVMTTSNSLTKRLKVLGNGHDSLANIGLLSVYPEHEGIFEDTLYSYNGGINYGSHKTFNINEYSNDIVKFTNDRFKKGEYNTIIGRFHTEQSLENGDFNDKIDITSTAKSRYGMSRGRNLLKKNGLPQNVNGYFDPYCRVWTYHKQYSNLNSLIRPFSRENGSYDELTYNLKESYHINRDRLDEFGTKEFNGLVKIAPTNKYDITKCMFSLENLAWKNEKKLFNGHSDQIGPLGGRIMWFPPYDIKFSESVNVGWNENNFIGRGEPIYTYTNTNRSGVLSFKLLIDHPSLINHYRGGINDYGNQDVDDVGSVEQTLLRFFAGCDVLEGRKRKIVKNEDNNKLDLEPLLEPIISNNNISKEIVFYVFFPNNYSGVDDSNGIIKPMEYLINGLGSGLKYENGQIKTISTDFTEYTDKSNKPFGGYEMGKGNNGISYLSETEVTDLIKNGAYDGSIKLNDKITLLPQKHAQSNNSWYYRVDKDVVNEKLKYNKNYFDYTSFGLNTYDGFEQLISYHTDAKKYKENGSLYSFADVFAALNSNSNSLLNEKRGLINVESVNEIKKIIEEYDIISIETKGFSSKEGHSDSNNRLNKNRANSVINWLIKSNNKFVKNKHKDLGTAIGSNINSDISSLESKAFRCTKVVISLSKEEITSIDSQKTLTEGQINYFNRLLVKYADDENAKLLLESGIKIDSNVYDNLNKVQKEALISLIRKSLEDVNFKIDDLSEVVSSNNLNDNIDAGYGKEYEFFSELSYTDTLLHHRLKDKIKYFDPAFHSISPEGFNARLNFLHQCTRQGSTYSSSDFGNLGKTTDNLSFGAPPVCVLRLGDFYNTKIIITNMNIEFSDPTWDLNDEGIGVMPMMADISLSFNFLGGSDLASPISRLQNAVSFNYYANTVVYDDRADRKKI